jgi:hypothetical protein
VLPYKALPKLKLKFHGLNFSSILFIAFKKRVDSSSEKPPERKLIPGNAAGIVRLKVLTVYHATSPTLAFLSTNWGF